MKETPPNEADIRAILQLNVIVSMMVGLPVALVVLELVLIGADLLIVSSAFLVAVIGAWLAIILTK